MVTLPPITAKNVSYAQVLDGSQHWLQLLPPTTELFWPKVILFLRQMQQNWMMT